MNAALGVRFLPEEDLRLVFLPPFFAAPLRADLREEDFRDEDLRDEDFLPPLFFLVAIWSPGW